MAWPALLQDLVVREPGEQQQAQLLGQLAAEFRRDGTPVIKLVEALGPWLTGEDDAQRSRATGLLSEVRSGRYRWLKRRIPDGSAADVFGHPDQSPPMAPPPSLLRAWSVCLPLLWPLLMPTRW